LGYCGSTTRLERGDGSCMTPLELFAVGVFLLWISARIRLK
jgi:hypothetical protein